MNKKKRNYKDPDYLRSSKWLGLAHDVMMIRHNHDFEESTPSVEDLRQASNTPEDLEHFMLTHHYLAALCHLQSAIACLMEAEVSKGTSSKDDLTLLANRVFRELVEEIPSMGKVLERGERWAKFGISEEDFDEDPEEEED